MEQEPPMGNFSSKQCLKDVSKKHVPNLRAVITHCDLEAQI